GGQIEAEKWGFLPCPISSPGRDLCLPLRSADPVAAEGSRPQGGVGGATGAPSPLAGLGWGAPGKDRLCLCPIVSRLARGSLLRLRSYGHQAGRKCDVIEQTEGKHGWVEVERGVSAGYSARCFRQRLRA